MTQNRIEYGNRLMAEFMNLGNDIEGRISFMYSIGEEFPYTLRICTEDLIESEVQSEIDDMASTDFMVETYSFHNSWDWLMPVYNKITNEQLFYDIEDNRGRILYDILVDRIIDGCTAEELWEVLVDFIEWYNKILYMDALLQDK